MRARRVWQVAGADYQSQIDKLHSKLADFNRRIEELEKVHPAGSLIESLNRTSFFQIDKAMSSLLFVASAGGFTGYDPG